MTCIVALIDDTGRAWMGGDRAAQNYSYVDIISEPKVRRIGRMLIGGSGESWIINAVLLATWPTPQPEVEPFGWLVREVTPWLREFLKDMDGMWPNKEEGWPTCGTSFVLTLGGRLWRIGGQVGVLPLASRYYVDGPPQGDGVLFALERTAPGMAPAARIEMALSAAAHHALGVRPPFDIINDEKG